MVKLVLRLSALAKGALAAALVGCGLAVYGKQTGTPWVGGVGTVLFFGGAIVYGVERLRMIRRNRSARKDP